MPGITLAEERSLVFLIGPTTEDHGHAVARAAAGVVREWFETPGVNLDLRYTASLDTQTFNSAMTPRNVEANLNYAADTDRKVDLKGLLNGFDRAGFTLTHHPGKRLMVVLLDAPELNSDAEDRLAQSTDFFGKNGIQVIVVDLTEPASRPAPAALATMASSTGGMLLRDLAELEGAVQKLFPTEKPATVPEKSQSAANPVRTRFLRIQSPKARASGTEFAPMHGYFLTEVPIAALQLKSEGSDYSGKVRVTEVLRSSDGKAVWQAKKDIVIKGPARRLEARQSGKLSYMRELQVPGGKYTLDATVEDLTAGKSLNATKPLDASPSTPGFDASDAVLVRPLDDATDRFETDTALVFDAKALVPLLDPPYRANQPFDLQVYMVLYPDLRGGKPDLNLEIYNGGQAVAKSRLAFNENIRNTSTEGSGLDARGGQKDEFPYLAALQGVSLGAGSYEVGITIRQDKRTLVRTLAFQVR